jgi:hypothetical protein
MLRMGFFCGQITNRATKTIMAVADESNVRIGSRMPKEKSCTAYHWMNDSQPRIKQPTAKSMSPCCKEASN